MDTFPDLGALSDGELKDLIQQLTEEEVDISYRRRILHGKIDILRAELVNRLRKRHEGGEEVITGADVQRLTDILAGRYALKRGAELKINWWGRLAVTPVMAALFAGLVGWETVGAILIWIGLAMALIATFEYSRSIRRQLDGGAPSTSA